MSDNPQDVQNVEFKPNQMKYIEWLATPKSLRTPQTKEELADLIGVNIKTLKRWEALPGFWQARDTILDQYAAESDTDVITAMVLTASTPGKDGTSDRKLYLQWRGKLVERSDVNVTIDPYSELIAKLRKEREPKE